ncbi:hypothetical protein ACJIZ3_020238 [Penstemon smallii]|uniref:Uncharacterized protein n=1 Tax=Penstemon smallii TaxID=265156 RepID=A0ABD3SI20_9LAMI
MASSSNSSYETSWADQWDPEPLYSNKPTHTSPNNNSKLSDKSKAAASTGVKKVRTGATAGINWIKHKYSHKTSNKN